MTVVLGGSREIIASNVPRGSGEMVVRNVPLASKEMNVNNALKGSRETTVIPARLVIMVIDVVSKF